MAGKTWQNLKRENVFQNAKTTYVTRQLKTDLVFKVPWLAFWGTEMRWCICCEEDDDEEDDVTLAALVRGQPSVPGAERGRELVAQ